MNYARASARHRTPRVLSAAVAVGTATALTLGSVSTGYAAETDTSEAEGRVLSGSGGSVNLNDIADLAPAYVADPEGGEQASTIDLTVLNALNIDLGGGVQLFGENGVIGIGALGQYASANGTSAYASSGAITDEGAIAIGGDGAGDNAYIDVTELLDAAGVSELTDGLIDQLRLELGALSASAQAEGTLTEGDYQIADGRLLLSSPAVEQLTAELNTVLDELSDTANGILGAEGTVNTALETVAADLVEPLTEALEAVTFGIVDVNNVALTAAADVDLTTALSAITSQPLTNPESPVAIDLSTGAIEVDLARLIADSQGGTYDGTLNNLDPNTEILEPELI